MRLLDGTEVKKRGCYDCTDSISSKNNKGWSCKHDECPYHELDSIEVSYKAEYLRKFDNSLDALRSILKD